MPYTELFRTGTDAEVLVLRLKEAGFTANDISVLLPDKQGTKDFAHEKNTKAPEGAATGGITGAGVGAALGWLAGIGSLAIPGRRPPDCGRSDHGCAERCSRRRRDGRPDWRPRRNGHSGIRGKAIRGKIRGGNALVSIHTENGDEKDRAEKLLKQAGAQDISSSTEEKV
jgi:hypothetical protein